MKKPKLDFNTCHEHNSVEGNTLQSLLVATSVTMPLCVREREILIAVNFTIFVSFYSAIKVSMFAL